MNIISCDNCGVLLDADKLDFPSHDYSDIDGQVDPEKAQWNKDIREWVPCVRCPVCNSKVSKPC